jgi:hypothetical protein
VNLPQIFLSLVERTSKDLDVDSLRDHVHAFSERHPTLTTREKGERLIRTTARRGAALGAIASLPPGWAAALTLGPELSGLLVMQSRMILSLHLLYGGVPEPHERALEVMAGLAAGAGINFGRRMTARMAEELAERLVVRLVGREATHFVPLFGAAVAGTMNYLAILGVGKAAIARVESLYGPPPRFEPVVDVCGTVA